MRGAALRVLRGVGVHGQVVTDRLPTSPEGVRLEFHHVVAQGLAQAQQARDIMARHGIAIDDLANAAILPLSFHQSGRLHTDVFVRDVNRYLRASCHLADAAVLSGGVQAGRIVLLERLRELGDLLSFRSGSVYAAAWQGVLRAAERLVPR